MAVPGVNNRKRLLVLMGFFMVGLLALLIFRVGYWQVIRAQWLQEKAADQWTREVTVEAERGQILDRNGQVLAASASCDSVVLRPQQIEDADAVADQLSAILGMDRQTIYIKAVNDKKSEIWLKRQITSDQAEQIRTLDLPGVVLTEDKKRYYPMGNFLTQVLGFTSVDGDGLEGIEARFNKYLTGTDGLVVTETDRDGNELPFNEDEYVAPVEGNNVTLTIDWNIQSILEKYCLQCMEEKQAEGVTAIAMDPSTGEILGLCNEPSFDNNDPPRDDAELLQDLVRNTAISDAYEPGSTFKIITTAAALDSGAVNLDTTFNCPGYRIIDGQKIKCWATHPHGTQTLTKAVQNSCNPAFMDMALLMGEDTFYDYIYNFGFGSRTNVQLYGEGTGIVTALKYIRNVDLARIGFGQSIAVTPLQLATAACAVVNGGYLMEPSIISQITDGDGNVIMQWEPTQVRQVISEETSAQMREILEAVVADGSGRNAQVEGYSIGGKTGTAQKYDEDGNVIHDVHISSFLGFAPADDPQVLILMVVDEATVGSDYGSIVAAPYVGKMFEEILQYMNVPRQSTDDSGQTLVTVPDVTNMELEQSVSLLDDDGFEYMVEGYSGQVVEQMPPAGSQVSEGSTIMLYLEQEDPDSGENTVKMPDLTGMSALEAESALKALGINIQISGQGGVVVGQTPAADEDIYVGDTAVVKFAFPDG